MFAFWDSVGGRFILLLVCNRVADCMLRIGFPNFEKLFSSAAHYLEYISRHSNSIENIPVLLALIGILRIPISFGATSEAILFHMISIWPSVLCRPVFLHREYGKQLGKLC